MCRFIAYLGAKPTRLARIIEQPTHSLIKQSRKAVHGKHIVNADGFGIGWYDLRLDPTAGVFKSIQPAWNDQNLHHISSKIQSTCFIGHIRASTVGNVNQLNCHPFSYDNLLFAHNGTIKQFDSIKRKLQSSLSDRAFFSIHGETDSEHFFSLFHNILHTEYESATLENMKSALLKAIKTISDMQNDIGKGDYSLLNTVITDGEQLIATRYTTANAEKQESLYYTFGEHILPQIGNGLMQPVESGKVGAVLIASEPINEKNEEWIEVPRNHIVIVNKDLEITVEPIKI